MTRPVRNLPTRGVRLSLTTPVSFDFSSHRSRSKNPAPTPAPTPRNHPHSGIPASNPSPTPNFKRDIIWREYVHLNGGIYSHNRALQLTTQEDIKNPDIQERLHDIRDQYLFFLEVEGLLTGAAEDWEFNISGLGSPSGPKISRHSWKEAKLFTWLSESKQEVQHNKVQSWKYIVDYPMQHVELVPNTEIDFVNALAYGANERVFDHKDTTYPFNDMQTQRLVRVYQDLKALQAEGQMVIPALAWHIARAMLEIEQSRWDYKYGTSEARIYRNVAIPKPTWKLRILDFTLLFLLFGAHTTYRKRLETTRPKGVIYIPDFRSFIQSLLLEWGDSNLLATVFVSANVAFLAVPGVNPLQRTASLISSLFAMMSIVSGVHHVWQHREKADAELEDASRYLHHFQMFGEELDLTVTACFLSLPLVSLMWSVLSFTVSIAAFCVQASDVHGKTLLIIILSIIGLAACGMFFFFWHIWRSPPHSELEDDFTLEAYKVIPLTWREKLRGKARRLLRREKAKGEATGTRNIQVDVRDSECTESDKT